MMLPAPMYLLNVNNLPGHARAKNPTSHSAICCTSYCKPRAPSVVGFACHQRSLPMKAFVGFHKRLVLQQNEKCFSYISEHLLGTSYQTRIPFIVRHCATSAQNSETASETAPNAQKPSPRYSPLHFNIEDFCQRVVPTEEEKKLKFEVIEGITQAAKRAFAGEPFERRVKVETFGSFANGLSTWNSDVDLVITGVTEPDRVTGAYDRVDRSHVATCLQRLAAQMRRAKRMELTKLQLIRFARIPIIKIRSATHVSVDISMSDDSGPRAARYIAQQARAYPPLRPLVLVMKTLLRVNHLNEVAQGGLASYSLTNMIIAHLQEEMKAGRDIFDLGETLYSFLIRYGEEFKYNDDAVSVASGGIVSKSTLGFADNRLSRSDIGEFAQFAERICVDDPLTGRDIAGGTYRLDLLRDMFTMAARKLEAAASGRKITDTSFNYLSVLFDVNRVCKRSYADEYDNNLQDWRVRAGVEDGDDQGGSKAHEEDDDEMEEQPKAKK